MAELTRTYLCADFDNTRMITGTSDSGSGYGTGTLAISRFRVSGDTSSTIGVAKYIKIYHSHTYTGTLSTYVPMYVVVTFNNGNTMTSDDFSNRFYSGSATQWINTISSDDASLFVANMRSGISSIAIKNRTAVSKSVYWRATSSNPIQIQMVFEDRIPNSPTVTASFSGAHSSLNKYFANATSPILNTTISVDSVTSPSIISKKLTLTKGSTVIIKDLKDMRTGSVSEGIGIIKDGGTYSWRLDITDSNSKSATASGTIVITSYTPPNVASFSASRYVSNFGEDTESVNGTSIWANWNVTFDRTVSGNTLTLTVYRVNNGSNTLLKTFSGITTSPYVSNKVKTPFTSTYSASLDYSFIIKATDLISSAWSNEFVVQKSGAVFDIERYGVAVGKRSEATQLNPMFEVAWPMVRYGLYDTDERVIGTIKRGSVELPVYEQTIVAENLNVSGHESNVVATLSAGSDLDMVLGMSAFTFNGDNWQSFSWWTATSNQYFEISKAGEVRVVCYASTFQKILATVRYTRKSDLT